MNIFQLDNCISKSVKYHSDTHVNSQLKEAVQILSTAIWHTLYKDYTNYNLLGSMKKADKELREKQKEMWKEEMGLSVPTQLNHPAMKWGRDNVAQYLYTLDYAVRLEREFLYRTGNKHGVYPKIVKILQYIPEMIDNLPNGVVNHQILFKVDNLDLHTPKNKPIECYKEYYSKYKQGYVNKNNEFVSYKWTKREKPEWMCN